MNSFSSLAHQARRLGKANTGFSSAGFLLDLAAYVVAGVDLSLSSDPSRQHEVAMPDEWLGAVAELPEVSPAGLAMLAKAVSKKGWVSVAEAVEFVAKEEAVLASAAKRKAVAEAQTRKGAALLLARAEKERPGLLESLTTTASEFTDAAAGVVSFTVEKTLLVGKGLDLAAGALRGLRRAIS